MREIKFRAWDKKKKKMFAVQGTESTRFGNMHHAIVYIGYANIKRLYIGDIELMQYTGLKDKNGKEIYEGDIISTSNFGEPYTDEWNSKEFGYAKVTITPDSGINFEGDDINWSWSDKESVYSLKYCEIIGNIFENPELLK